MSADQEHEESSAGSAPDRPLAPGLYLVATPIGNLEDITLRALRVLRSADRIACEDTRQTQKLLNHFDIRTPTVSYHLHNEAGRAAELVAELKAGARIAVVSDAGTPGIADPGGQIAAAAIAAGVPVFPIPGANAAISALIASGLGNSPTSDAGPTPTSNASPSTASSLQKKASGAPRSKLSAPPTPAGAQIFYEAPHRILAHPRRHRGHLRPRAAHRRRPRAHQAPRGVPARGCQRSPRHARRPRHRPRRDRPALHPRSQLPSQPNPPPPPSPPRSARSPSRASPKKTPSSKSPAPATSAKATPTANSNANAANNRVAHLAGCPILDTVSSWQGGVSFAKANDRLRCYSRPFTRSYIYRSLVVPSDSLYKLVAPAACFSSSLNSWIARRWSAVAGISSFGVFRNFW